MGNIKELSVGKAYKIEANRLFTNSFRGHLYDASTNPVTLHKGWNWVGYPYMEKAQIDVITNAEEGDYVTSQTGFAEYADGNWEGTLDTFMPGEGYLYKSASEKDLTYDTSIFVSASRAWRARTAIVTEKNIDIHRYPNTMNVTAHIYRDGIDVSDQAYNIYALAGNELRGVGQFVGQNHYLTIYGDGATEISFVIENAETGDNYIANETLMFRSDVVGSRQNPFGLNIGDATGIDVVGSDKRPMTVYSLQGVLISKEATLKMLHSLPKGVYIINGQKCFIK